MGTETEPLPKPDPVPPGSQCSICWGVGAPFEGTDTPSEIEVSFSGIQKGPQWESWMPEPFNQKFTLLQDNSLSCFFETYVPYWQIYVKFTSTSTEIFIIRVNPYIVMFRGYSLNRCGLFVLNDKDDAYTYGTALISFEVTE